MAKLDTRLKYVEGALHSTQVLAFLTARVLGRTGSGLLRCGRLP